MSKQAMPVVKAGWGRAQTEFISRLPEMLPLIQQGRAKTFIHRELQLQLSYRQFCKLLKKRVPDKTIHPRPAVTLAASQQAPSGSFTLRAIDLDAECEGNG